MQLALWRSIGLGLVFSTIFLTFGVGYWCVRAGCSRDRWMDFTLTYVNRLVIRYGARLIARGGEDFGGVFTSVFSAVLGSLAVGLAAPNLVSSVVGHLVTID